MTQEDRQIHLDRMRFTKNALSSSLVLVAILFDVFYFVSVYQSDVGTFYYSMLIGASIVYNLIFMLSAFLASEGVKSRKAGYTLPLIALGAGQFIRMFIIPAKAHAAVATVAGEEVVVMGDGQYWRLLVFLGISGICCIAAAVTSYIQNRDLANYMASLEQTRKEA